MTGRIIDDPGDGHRCDPPPSPECFWAGTVWECACGRTWVSNIDCWRPESRFARWRRRFRGDATPTPEGGAQ